jgi:hypothetical protein
MNGDFILVVTPLAGLAFNVLLQVTGFRYTSRLSMLKSIVAGFLFGFVVVIIGSVFFLIRNVAEFSYALGILMANILTYTALGYCYFHFINLGETARRVRILREICEAGGALSLEEILSRYNGKMILQYRMARLLNNAQVIEHNGRYIIGNPIMLFITKIIVALKLMVIGKRSEFD